MRHLPNVSHQGQSIIAHASVDQSELYHTGGAKIKDKESKKWPTFEFISF